MKTKDDGTIRKFDTGATRDTSKDKLEPHGFLSPEVLHRFSQYMHKHRFQSDGSMRDADNWKKGIPTEEYEKSFIRHAMDFWALTRGEGKPLYDVSVGDPEEVACALMFNIQGWLHERLKQKKMSITYTMGTMPMNCAKCGKTFGPGEMAYWDEKVGYLCGCGC